MPIKSPDNLYRIFRLIFCDRRVDLRLNSWLRSVAHGTVIRRARLVFVFRMWRIFTLIGDQGGRDPVRRVLVKFITGTIR